MKIDDEGFWYPRRNDVDCKKCGLCVNVCPVLQNNGEMVYTEELPKAFACFCNDFSVRLKSSSGGVFTLLAKKVISDNGVVYGVRFDQHFNVVHGCVDTIDELEHLRGSKYVQSNIGYTFREVEGFLKQNRYVLFSGTPCQVAGLKAFLRKDYNNLICIDIICHGVPSPLVWKLYVSYREEKAEAKTRKVFFRNKDNGWKKYSIKFLFYNEKKYMQTVDNDLFMRAFLSDICLRPSCYQCNFKSILRQSDITIADFWGIQYVAPEMDDDKGTSLVLLNSCKGLEIFEKIKLELKYSQVDVKTAIKYNPSAIRSSCKNKRRDKFFNSLNHKRFDNVVNRYCGESILVTFYRVARLVRSMIRRFIKLFC